MTPHLLPARSPICRELFVPAQAISRDTAGVRVGECTAPATVDHELPCARYSAFRAPSRSFVYTACRCLGSIIIFSQIKLTRPDRFSAVARSSPRPIWPGGTALLSIIRAASKTFCTRASTSSRTKNAMSSFALSPLTPSSLQSFSIVKRRRAAAPRGDASNVWVASSHSRRTLGGAWSFGSGSPARLGQTS